MLAWLFTRLKGRDGWIWLSFYRCEIRGEVRESVVWFRESKRGVRGWRVAENKEGERKEIEWLVSVCNRRERVGRKVKGSGREGRWRCRGKIMMLVCSRGVHGGLHDTHTYHNITQKFSSHESYTRV
jgi:hypothetical protein